MSGMLLLDKSDRAPTVTGWPDCRPNVANTQRLDIWYLLPIKFMVEKRRPSLVGYLVALDDRRLMQMRRQEKQPQVRRKMPRRDDQCPLAITHTPTGLPATVPAGSIAQGS